MINFYKKSQFEEKFTEVEKIEDKNSMEYFFKYMMLIISFGKAIRLSEYGYKEGVRLYKQWSDEEEDLTREESMLIGFLLSDISIIECDLKIADDLKIIYNQMITKYKPDFAYLQEFGQNYLLQGGYVEPNPHYMQTVNQMFTTDMVLPDPEQILMIQSGEMPIYDDIKVCPYCSKQFGTDVELLFKHVKAEHGKK